MSVALTFFEESNHKKKDMLLHWVVSNIDYSQLKRGLPVCFYRNASFYLTELPDFSRWPHDFKCRVLSVLVDGDMKDDLEQAGVINWCRNVRAVVPISVPKDGNCLLHSVGIAVWGILDSNLMLRKLLGLALSVDKGHRFYSRWRCHRQMQMSQVAGQVFEAGPQDLQKEWSEISNCLDPDQSSSAAVPHRFLESIHVYTLANILRRPVIIMTDPTMRTFSGFALQDNDMGGIYLPLEWTWTDTNRTPLLLGYSHNHFSPLLFAEHPNQAMAGATQRKDLAPLVNAQFEQLPVRFLLTGEEPEVGELLRKYLKIKETVTTINGNVQNILCAELEICNLPDELNVVKDFFKVSYDIYRQEQAFASPQQMPGMMPFQDLPGRLQNAGHQHMLNQGARYQPAQQSSFSYPQEVVRKQLQGLQGGSEYAMGDPALHIPNPCGQGSVRIPPPSFTPRYSFGENSVSLNPPQEKKCVVPTCKYFGDPDLAMMCSNCFKNYSIRESRQMAISGMLKTQPSAPMASFQGEERHYEMSIMAERCKTGCGYRCSTKTYPYCHECAGKRQKQAQEEARARKSQPAGAPHATPGVWTSASSAAGSHQPEDILKPVASHQHVESSQAKSTPPTSPLPASSSAGAPKLSQAPGEASASAVAGEAISPTQALAAGTRAAPLTPPDDPSDLMLFASGEHTPVMTPAGGQVLTPAAAHPGHTPVHPASQNAATVPTQSQVLSSSGQQTAGFASNMSNPQIVRRSEDTSTWSSACQQRQEEQVPQTGGGIHEQSLTPGSRLQDTQISGSGENRQQMSPVSSITQQKHQHQQSLSHMTGQAMLSAGLSESQLAEAVVGPAQSEPVGPVPKCTGCQDEAVHKNLCGKCYMMKGAGAASSPAVQKTKMTSLNSTSSSAPASMGVQAAGAKLTYPFMGETAGTFNLPTAQPKSSSLSHLPKDVPAHSTNKDVYVQNWLKGVQKAPVPKAPASFEQKRQPMGLPENQEGEPLLSNSDLLASGENCYSSTIRCIGEGCNNRVVQEGRLCDQCQQILRQARQSQGQQQSSRTSVQESLPPLQSLCKTEDCNYCGNPTQLGYCSRCYEKLVSRQKEEERRFQQQGQRRVTSSPLPQSIPANIRVPAEFHHVPLPQGRQGELCRALGCNMFGDPKQNNMCYKHYQEQLAQMSSGVQNPTPPQSARYLPPSPARGTVHIPYAQEVRITPSGATFITPAGGREVLLGAGELAASGSFPHGEVSVPPPSYPTPESRIGGGVRSQEQSLNETYNRVVNRGLSPCLNPTCSNFGNSSKGGLCNSCASLDQLGEDLIRRTVLGEEEIG